MTYMPKRGVCLYCLRPVGVDEDELIVPHFGHPAYGGGRMSERAAKMCNRGGYPPRQIMTALIVISRMGTPE